MARTPETPFTNSSVGVKFRACQWARSRFETPEPPELINPGTGYPYLEAASQDFKANDMVYLNGGAVTEVLTGDDLPIMGIALVNATATTGSQIRIMPVNSHDEFIMNTYADTASGTLKAALGLLVGRLCNLTNVTVTETDASVFYGTVVDMDHVDNARVMITGLVEDTGLTATSTYNRVYVKYLPVFYETGVPSHQGLQLDT